MTRNAIEFHAAGKSYHLGEDFSGSRYLTLREALLRKSRRHQAPSTEIWALRGLDLTVAEGEILGVIGRNGAGKSTLLKLLARITEPTTGLVRTRGRVGALLEVGTGFHPELTGRENVFLNGSILGMSRTELKRHFDEIVEFAGFEQFLDTPLKRFSTGMGLRLAFAVAAYVRPPIVAVDEVLAVGDAEFRERCLEKMSDLGSSGRTIVFVSHDLAAISQLCTRTVWLEDGSIAGDGATPEIISAYLGSKKKHTAQAELAPAGHGPVQLRTVRVLDSKGEPAEILTRSEPLTVRVEFDLLTPVPRLDMAITMMNSRGVMALDEAFSDTGRAEVTERSGRVRVDFGIPPVLASDDYTLGVWLGAFEDTFVNQDVLTFHLWPGADDPSDWQTRARVVQPTVTWSVASVGDS